MSKITKDFTPGTHASKELSNAVEHSLTFQLYVLPIVERTSIEEATFNASSIWPNLSLTKSKFLQQIVNIPCCPLTFFSTCSTAECNSYKSNRYEKNIYFSFS